MLISRRDMFRSIGAGGLRIAAPVVALATPAAAATSDSDVVVPTHPVGLLYDATLCTGCKACVDACVTVNGLKPDTHLDGLHMEPMFLNAQTKNIIELCKATPEHPESFVKLQCMHCGDPACVAACPFEALEKHLTTGIVEWKADKCIGCRFCEIACPFHVPKFEWSKFNPNIVKCELCNFRLAKDEEPACTYVCPTKAVVFGWREDLLETAKARVAVAPGKYFENRVYGEKEAGGTQCLYLSAIPFSDLGLPTLDTNSIPGRLRWQKVLYKWMAGPLMLYAGIVTLMKRNWGQHEKEMRAEEKDTGLEEQL